MSTLALMACQRIAVRDRTQLAAEIELRAAMRVRAELHGAAYLSHAAGCGHVVAAEAAAKDWFFFTSTERQTALVLHCLGKKWQARQGDLR